MTDKAFQTGVEGSGFDGLVNPGEEGIFWFYKLRDELKRLGANMAELQGLGIDQLVELKSRLIAEGTES